MSEDDGDSLFDRIQRAAMAATGMTKAELLAEAEKLPPPPVFHEVPVNRVRRRMEAAGVPEIHIRHLADEPPRPCRALERVQHLCSDPNENILVLSGGTGTMKTGSACQLLGTVDRGVFVVADELLAIAFEDKARLLELKRARAVVLDDLGREIIDDKGYWMRTFTSLMDAWYGSCAKVIITTNVEREPFLQQYDERALDRIRESGARQFVTLGGDSVRSQLAAARGA
jgi:DNA replication protein DnaC